MLVYYTDETFDLAVFLRMGIASFIGMIALLFCARAFETGLAGPIGALMST